ncbi:MAG: ribosome small subunit-dependent GTPase A [Bacteroidota bacterium]
MVSRVESKDCYVLVPEIGKIIRCAVKGKFKNEYNLKKDKLYKVNLAVVGDNVEFEENSDGTGVVYKIKERDNYLSRKAPKIKGAGYRGERLEQVIAANVDNLFVVSSVGIPKFNNKAVDRLIVAGESSGLNIYLIINKTDLDNDYEAEAWKELYETVGYHVVASSAVTGEGTDEIRGLLKGKKNIFWGHSGVGKSSLLNTMYPSLKFRTGETSSFTQKGKHTTVTSIMVSVEPETYIIDTPGIREIDPYGITKENLGHYFIEFKPYIDNCRFNTCTHNHEPGCAVVEAVEEEKIPVERYESYLYLLETIEEGIVF